MQRPKRAATEPCGGVHRSGFQCTAATPTSSGLLKQPDKQKLATFALHKPLDQGGAAREICGSKFHNAPWWGSVSKTAADETVSAKIVACVERCAVNVYSEPTLGDRKIGNGNWSLTLTGRYGNLLLRNESVLLKQPKKLQFEWRSDSGSVGFKPWLRIIDIACLKGAAFCGGMG